MKRLRLMVAMSGGVDSSVAAAWAAAEGHDVTGVTLRLWGGESDTGCCSVSDVDDARRTAQQLGIDHVVFNMGAAFEHEVVAPYVAAHASGSTPNPCIECNRHIKFDRLLRRASALGFDALVTGHHARVVVDAKGGRWVARGVDQRKDQSYVLAMLGRTQLERILLPVGEMTKAEVRAQAAALGLRTADKPDSQDVCFVTRAGGRGAFLGARIPLRPAEVVEVDGAAVGAVPSLELVTVGQRRGLGVAVDGSPRYVLEVDAPGRRVVVGSAADLLDDQLRLEALTWASTASWGALDVQTSAHGSTERATIVPGDAPSTAVLRWSEPTKRVAPGQSVAFYEGDRVVGGGIVSRRATHAGAPLRGALQVGSGR